MLTTNEQMNVQEENSLRAQIDSEKDKVAKIGTEIMSAASAVEEVAARKKEVDARKKDVAHEVCPCFPDLSHFVLLARRRPSIEDDDVCLV